MVTQIKAVFGGGSFPHGPWADPKVQAQALEVLEKAGVNTIDTARLYPGSEDAIGALEAKSKFIIDSKVKGGFSQGPATKSVVLSEAEESIKALQIPQLDILYIHAPDASTPFADTLEGINEAHKRGWFKRFGLSNFTAAQVQEVYDIAKEKGWVLPTVYQGNYSPVAQHLEKILFPTLRKLDIVFYAYSPLAGGFLTKTPQQLDEGVGRFNPQAIGGLYKNLYDKPSLRAALGEWNAIADAEGVSKAELAYRWVGYNSALKAELGDAVIFGASSMRQIEETAAWLKKGPLSQDAVARIAKLWESVKQDAPVDNFGNKL